MDKQVSYHKHAVLRIYSHRECMAYRAWVAVVMRRAAVEAVDASRRLNELFGQGTQFPTYH